MTAKLTLELDNQTQKGFSEVRRDLSSVATESRRTDTAIEGLNIELKEMANEFNFASEKIRQAARDQESFNRSANDVKDKAGGSWLGFASKLGGVKAALHNVWEAGQKTGEVIHFLAEKGVPAFQNLSKAGARFQDTIVDVASDQRLAKWVNRTADLLNGPLTFAFKGVSDVALSTLEATENLFKSKLQILIDEEARKRDAVDADKKREKDRLDRVHADVDNEGNIIKTAKQKLEERERELFEVRKARGLAEFQRLQAESVAKETDLKEVDELLQRQYKRRDHFEKEAATADDKRRKEAKEEAERVNKFIVELEKQRHRLVMANAEQEAALKSTKADQELQAKERMILKEKELAQAIIDGELAAFNVKDKLQRARFDAEAEATRKLKNALFGGGMAMGPGFGGGFNPALGGQMPMGGMLGGGFGGGPAFEPPPGMMGGPSGGNMIESLLGRVLTPQRIRRKIIEMKEREAVELWLKKNAGKFDQHGAMLTKDQLTQVPEGPELSQVRPGWNDLEPGDAEPGRQILLQNAKAELDRRLQAQKVAQAKETDEEAAARRKRDAKRLASEADERDREKLLIDRQGQRPLTPEEQKRFRHMAGLDVNPEDVVPQGWNPGGPKGLADAMLAPETTQELNLRKRRFAIQMGKAKTEGRMKGLKDLRSGNIGPDDLGNAQGEIIDELVDGFKMSVNVAGRTVSALKMGLREVADGKRELGKVLKELDESVGDFKAMVVSFLGRSMNSNNKNQRTGQFR